MLCFPPPPPPPPFFFVFSRLGVNPPRKEERGSGIFWHFPFLLLLPSSSWCLCHTQPPLLGGGLEGGAKGDPTNVSELSKVRSHVHGLDRLHYVYCPANAFISNCVLAFKSRAGFLIFTCCYFGIFGSNTKKYKSQKWHLVFLETGHLNTIIRPVLLVGLPHVCAWCKRQEKKEPLHATMPPSPKPSHAREEGAKKLFPRTFRKRPTTGPEKKRISLSYCKVYTIAHNNLFAA